MNDTAQDEGAVSQGQVDSRQAVKKKLLKRLVVVQGRCLKRFEKAHGKQKKN
jgi:hypothetical protein